MITVSAWTLVIFIIRHLNFFTFTLKYNPDLTKKIYIKVIFNSFKRSYQYAKKSKIKKKNQYCTIHPVSGLDDVNSILNVKLLPIEVTTWVKPSRIFVHHGDWIVRNIQKSSDYTKMDFSLPWRFWRFLVISHHYSLILLTIQPPTFFPYFHRFFMTALHQIHAENLH